MRPAVSTYALLAAIAFTAACADAPAPEASDAPVPLPAAPAPTGPTLATASALGVRNAAEPAAGLLTAGQITQAQFDALAEAGYTTFVSLQLPSENGAGWEEAYAASKGIAFHRIPVGSGADLSREKVEELDRILDAVTGPKVVYCASSNRVGGILALRAAWLDGASPDEAMAFGRAAGMSRIESDVARLLAADGAAR